MLSLADAEGSILAEDILAPEPVPHFKASIMDGYAVLSSDGPGEVSFIFYSIPSLNRSCGGRCGAS